MADKISSLGYLFSHFSAFSIVLPIIAGLINYKSLVLPTRLLLFFFIYAAVNEALLLLLANLYNNNIYLVNFYVIIEFFVFSYIYYLILGKRIGKWIVALSVLYVPVVGWYFFNTDWLGRFNNQLVVVAGCILIAYSVFYYDAHLQEKIARNKSLFWFNTAVFFYFTLTTIFFIFNQYFQTSLPIGNHLVWIFHSFANVAFNLLIAHSLWRFRKTMVYSLFL